MGKDRMREAWDEYVNSQRVASFVPQQIASSWKRSQLCLNPYQAIKLQQLSEYHLLAAQVASFNLVSIARPVMEDAFQYLEHTSSAILFTNSAGYILEILGHELTMKRLAERRITKGGQFAEASVGTNAFSLAVQERVPVRVRGAEHYLQALHELDECAAPVFDPGGTPLGALGVINYCEEENMNALSLVAIGAKAIENQRQSDLLLAEQRGQLAQLKRILSSISEGILVWNAEGRLLHINDAAEKMVGVPMHVMVGRNYHDFFTLPAFIQETIRRQKTVRDVEVTFQVKDKIIKCILSLQFIIQDDVLQWVIATLRAEKEVRKLVLNQLGAYSSSTLGNLVGDSQKMQEIRRLVKVCANATAPVLIRGEDGTGKNLVAGAIHNEGERRNGPFIVFSSSAYTVDTILVELCGYEDVQKGAQRHRGQPGKMELANGGTLFIQDVDQLPLEAQYAVLNVMEMHFVQRIGSKRPNTVDVRLLASTRENLEKLVARGNFRSDLYYRLSTFEIAIPPLREEMENLQLLVHRILSRLERQVGHPLTLSHGVMDILRRYSWPGNVQELETVLERAAGLAEEGSVIQPSHLPNFMPRSDGGLVFEKGDEFRSQSFGEMEHEMIVRAARICNGNQTQMAEMLGISRTTLWRRLKAYSISIEDIRML